ncbi:salicylate synthase [Actinoallomurus acaciae]|uniref:Salicylate synthase n=1 Tax=Actinoallomurus acaciae TaxID=502577 RepID=A0ABV5YC83_9ACTN
MTSVGDGAMLPERFRSRTLPSTSDPLALGTALARRSAAPVMLYERAGEWSLGSGALVEISVRRDGVRVRRADGASEFRPSGEDPLQVVRAVLSELPSTGWRAYGWARFELAAALFGIGVPGAPDQTLAYVVVPEREIRLRPGYVELRAVREAELDRLTELVRVTRPDAEPVVEHLVDEHRPDSDYPRLVAEAIAGIHSGALKKVILSRRVLVDRPLDLPATYLAGRRANTPARSFLLDLGGLRAAGFSPETVVEVAAEGTVSTHPLAGTRALVGDPATDARLRRDLQGDSKEIVEHAMSVQLAQEELRGLCEEGSVRVTGFMDVLERGSVQHLASRLYGQLPAGRNAWHALRALFPAITASGIPKRAACSWIHRNEPEPRGLYSGAVLIADADGSLDAALVLRTIFEQDGRYVLRAGAGIVGASDPAREFEETCEKLRSVSRFLVPAGADPKGTFREVRQDG